MTSFTVAAILDKTENRDKDFRYMATSDLLAELQKPGFKPDSEGEKKICRCVLKLLSDQSSDVQGLAVKCLSPLVRKVHDELVDYLMVELCSHVLTGKEEQRDICSIGLKTVVLEMPASMGAVAARQLTARLISGIAQTTLEVKLECMDILDDMLKRFGTHLKEEESHKCLDTLFNELGSVRAAARKRAIACIASLSTALTDKLLAQMVTLIVGKMQDAGCKVELRRTYIQTLSGISRSGGYRLGKQLDGVLPIVLQQCDAKKSGGDSEMIESCLQAFECFVLRCPKEVAAFQGDISKTALQYLSYDPNYADDEDEDMEDEDDDMDDDADADEDDDDGDYSDDDDNSWKVRRAAAKVLSAIIVSRPERLPELMPLVIPVLVGRFKEREENVKMDVFATFSDLLQQVSLSLHPVDVATDDDATMIDAADAPTALLLESVPSIARGACRQLKEKSLKTRVAAFGCLRQLLITLPGCLAPHAAMVVPGLERALKEDGSNNLRTEALLLLQLALSSHPPAVFQPHVGLLMKPVLNLVNDRYYKIAAEALRVCSGFVRILRPKPPAAGFAGGVGLVQPLFDCVEKRLLAQDQDQEVKECAISCMGLVLCHLGDDPAVQLDRVLPVLLERLRNEITRVTTVKTFAALAVAKLDLKLGSALPGATGSVLQAAVSELCSFLRKSSRPLRQASLTTLSALVASHASLLGEADVSSVLSELPPLITDADLHVAHLALELCTTIVRAAPGSTVPAVKAAVMPQVLTLLQSSLFQGQALRSVLNFLGVLVEQDVSTLNFDVVTTQLLALASKAAPSKHTLASLSQAIAMCCTHTREPAKRDAMVASFVGTLRGASSEPAKRVLALTCLGEVGRRNDLAPHGQLLETIMAEFGSEADDVKAAASFALGNVAAGNLPVFMPYLLSELKASQQYLTLHALKDLIGSGQAQLADYIGDMLPHLVSFAQHEEEGVRNVVSECLGRLAATAPDAVVPQLTALLTHENGNTRATVVNSVRFAITEVGTAPLPPVLADALISFLRALSDAELAVRRGALLALNSAAHNKPAAVWKLLPELLPMLYAETVKRPELVHQVDLGPFKHTVDDGLELRKAAFECMDTLLAHCPDRLDWTDFVQHILSGLADDHDIKVLCHMMLGKLAVLPSSAAVLVASLDAITDPLRKTITATLKDNAVKQQIERHEDLVRSGMRAVRALEKISGADSSVKFDEFVRSVLKAGKLADKYAALCGEEEAKGDAE